MAVPALIPTHDMTIPDDKHQALLTDLLGRVAQGDEAALKQLYDLTSGRFYGLALRIVRAGELAEDVLQESFVRIWRKAHQYDPTLGDPLGWMAAVTRNVALDHLRRARVRDETGLQEADRAAGAPPVDTLERGVALIGTDGIRRIAATALMQPVLSLEGGMFAQLPAAIWGYALHAATAAADHAARHGRGEDALSAQLLGLLQGSADRASVSSTPADAPLRELESALRDIAALSPTQPLAATQAAAPPAIMSPPPLVRPGSALKIPVKLGGLNPGEDAKVVILSVTEGEDKPLKYPDMFAAAQLMLLTKTDLLPHLSFDVQSCVDYARRVNPGIRILQLSATTGEGMNAWIDWLLHPDAIEPTSVQTRIAQLEAELARLKAGQG